MATQHGQPDHADEVGGVTSGTEHTESLKRLIDGALVAVAIEDLSARLEPNEGHLSEQNLGLRLIKGSLLLVPTASFDIEAVNVGTVSGCLFFVEIAVLHNFVIPLDLIDSDGVLPRIVLLQASKETLGEEESTDPVVGRLAILDPPLNEAKTLNEINDVACKWLQRRIGALVPSCWDPIVEQSVTNILKFRSHHNLTLDGQLDILERSTDHIEQPIETKNLLVKHSVH